MSCVCAVCLKYVKKKQRKLVCTICNKYVHKQCSDVTNNDLRKNINIKYWHCNVCNDQIALPFNHITNESEYLLVLYKLFEIPAKSNRFENLAFNPLEDHTGDTTNEAKYGNCNNNTEYYTDDSMNELSKLVNNNNLSMLNVNIRSVYKNIDSLKDFLHTCDIHFNVIGISETWLKDQPHEYFRLDGYNMEAQNRPEKGGGGVCLFVDDTLNYTIREDINSIKHPLYTETLFIEIERPKAKNIIIGVVYKPPDQDVCEFNQYIENVLSSITKDENKLIYIMGDFVLTY